MRKGNFFTFEGIDGCGKSTQMKAVAARLEKEGMPLVITREPGGTPLAEKIRNIILDPDHKEMVDECELLLYCAARAQHVREKILPALNNGMIVLCDRFQEATFAYQGYGRGLSLELLRTINAFATGGVSPDTTFIFDIPVDISRQRLLAMSKPGDRLENNDRAFYERIREGYRKMAMIEPSRIEIIDGGLTVEEITGIVYKRIKELLRL